MTDDKQTISGTLTFSVDPWPKNLPYWNNSKCKYTSKCFKYFSGRCFRCGNTMHSSKNCPYYKRFERTMCETCRRGFHRICRYSEIVELSKENRTETGDNEEKQNVEPTTVMTKEQWSQPVENSSPLTESRSNSPIERSETLSPSDVMRNEARHLCKVDVRPSRTGPVIGPDDRREDRRVKMSLLCLLFAIYVWYIGVMYEWRDVL